MFAKSGPLRKLGKGGPSVPALGFGLMGMSFAYGTIPSDEDRFKVLDRAVELGATFWDSSEYARSQCHILVTAVH
jgi:aryl-alcohol dehydrogenase-like predicted oxidoreductase